MTELICIDPFEIRLIQNVGINFIIQNILIDYQGMYNSNKYQKNQINKSQLRTLDYRNAKYQGIVSGISLIRNGCGLLLDQNYLFLMANWQNSKVEGQTFILYPDDSLFYGFISNNSPANFCFFRLAKKVQIYSLIEKGDSIIFIIDLFTNKNLVCFSINREVIENILSAPTNSKYLLIEEYKKGKGMELQAETSYQNEEQKWKFIEHHLKKPIQPEFHNYKQFIKSQFLTQNKESSIRLSQYKTQVQIACGSSSSIFCKISHEVSNESDFKIKALGFLDSNEKVAELFKKSVGGKIEEGVNGEVKTYNEVQKKRPLDCLNRLQKYYKKSLNFVNEFIELDYLYGINYMYHSIDQCFQEIYTTKYAQKLLIQPNNTQMPKNSTNNNFATPIKISPDHKNSLHEAREDIYRAIQSKSGKKSLSYSKIKNSSISVNQYNAFKESSISSKRFGEERSKVTIKRKQKKYLQQEKSIKERQSMQKYSEGRSYYYRLQEQPKEQHKLSRLAYLQNDSGHKPTKQDLKELTKYYEAIDRQLKRSASTKNVGISKNTKPKT